MKVLNILTGAVYESEELEGPNFFLTPYLRPVEVPVEAADSRTMTEQSYIPVDVQVRDMQNAGLFLDAARKARFDSDLSYDPEEDIALDPARNPGADVVDILRAGAEAGRRLREQDAAAAARQKVAAEEAAGKARDELAAKVAGKPIDEVRQLLRQVEKTGG